jgi:hypothetical protein
MGVPGLTAVAVSVAALALAGTAQGEPRQARHGDAATRRALSAARRALLRRGDLRGWSISPPPKRAPILTCPSFSPDLSGAEPLASAASPTFGQTSNGPFVSQTAYVFASPARVHVFWQRVITRRLLACVADSLTAGSTTSVRFKVSRERLLVFPRVGGRDSAYRVSGTAASGGQTVNVDLDVVVVSRGSGVGALSFTSFFDPAPQRLELRLARLVAGRLQDGGSG